MGKKDNGRLRVDKVLINFSNHPSSKWDKSQKVDWKIVIDERFPRIKPDASKEDVEELVDTFMNRIKEIASIWEGTAEVWLHLVGQWSFCYLFIARSGLSNISGLAVPMADRDEDSRYQFMQWLYIRGEEFTGSQLSVQDQAHS
jgi:hypothetical protein